ncbi:MAG: thioredoxin family protein [Labilithrix sp.]|nr:thioredoxin family protein [Labilithrix sp.]
MRRALVVVALVACNPAAKTIGQEKSADVSVSANASANAPASAATADADAGRVAPRAEATGVKVVVAAEDSDALSIVRTERLKAKAEGRVLVVYVGATWCPPCRRLKEEIHAGRLDATLGKTTLLAFDADRDTERLAGAGYKFGFIPYVALPGADGRPSDSVEARGRGKESWRELVGKLEAWQKP